MPEYRVAFLRRHGPYSEEEAEVLEALHRWAGPRGLVKAGTVILVIHHDDPTMTLPEKCRTDACVEIPADYNVDAVEDPARVSEVPGGTFAVMPFRGTLDDIAGAWHAMFSDWLPRSGYQPDDRPGYLRCLGDTGANAGTDVLSCEVCLPVILLQETEQAEDSE